MTACGRGGAGSVAATLGEFMPKDALADRGAKVSAFTVTIEAEMGV